jgi:hypothetical protein
MNVSIFEYALELVDVSNDITNEFFTMIHKKNERSKIYMGAFNCRIYASIIPTSIYPDGPPPGLRRYLIKRRAGLVYNL